MSVCLYAFSSWIGIWNCINTPTINYRELMGGGGYGPSAKEDNGGREWFSAAPMTVDGGVAVGL